MTRNLTLTLVIALAVLGLVTAQGMIGTSTQAPWGHSGRGQGMMNQGMMNQGMMNQGMMGSMMGQGMMGSMIGQGMMGQSMMGQSMMGQSMMGQSMMGQGMMGGMGMMQTLPASATPLSETELRGRLVAAAAGFGPDARLADPMPFSNHTYAQVIDANGNGIAELLADRYTGVVMPEPGPNMMWNSAGIMGFGATPQGRYDQAAAEDLANAFLAGLLPGAKVLAGQCFPGYATFDYGRDGRVEGMLSVNTDTGLVWPHAWHGAFLAEAHD